ncbi:50S ribosomal protein L23 [Candidatus Deianiraea vastatrix]|uniref:Large ribosomal subunit protein uL23 n=1 Tax=Candidatus Deianiraea vastatrix TaxID=2163644 RepID=A0A5B8XD62_9RICK|nr:50S ribosomal protein L23 [Candidatus Deianiraea vastatrix]QED23190.1 50S ribosomal protein L23 [Candidatus Deianiraea vastatrix]
MNVQVIKKISLYSVIKKRVLTDKTYRINKQDPLVYTFVVDLKSDKGIIKNAVESIFAVKVDTVNTMRKFSISRSFKGRRSKKEIKIAYVKLKSGSIGDVYEA